MNSTMGFHFSDLLALSLAFSVVPISVVELSVVHNMYYIYKYIYISTCTYYIYIMYKIKIHRKNYDKRCVKVKEDKRYKIF